VTTTEIEWDDDERAAMLALHRCEQWTCNGCGGWLPETMGHEAEDYEVDPPTVCGKCRALAIHQEYQARDEKYLNVLRWNAKLKTPPSLDAW
jgi:hypothetical protein